MSEGHLSEKFGLEYTDAAKTIAGLRADKRALVAEVERLRESNKELVAALSELWAWLQGAQNIAPPDLWGRIKAALAKAIEDGGGPQ